MTTQGRPPSAETRARAEEYLRAGKPVKWIARRLGMCPKTVRKMREAEVSKT